MDPKDDGIMKQKPRNPNDGIFANGGMRDTIMHGVFITVAVIIAYLSAFWLKGYYSWDAIKNVTDGDVIHLAQTMAFTSLAFAELIHMVCMSNTEKSFVMVFKNKNWMMAIAFAAGVALQFFVILVPGVRDVFKTAQLGWEAWLITAAVSIVPLVAHEIIVLIKWIIRKNKKEN